MKIPLTQEKFAVVGPKDYVYLMQWKWCYNQGYAVRRHCTNGKWRGMLMHRIILERMGYKDFSRSDHINRDPLDNRRCNLRPATSRQSCCNRSKFKSNSSGYIGVHWLPKTKNWCARIQTGRRRISLGSYKSKLKAAKVYDEAARKYHGEFATLNGI